MHTVICTNTRASWPKKAKLVTLPDNGKNKIELKCKSYS